ncbi:MAG: hypothetical protein K9L62_02180 [Vallitaleaceae bacterium]|nr:hypothetical protein [Vallitaleaceae bacterium]
MDSSYNNFIARMGSFDESLDFQDEENELKHSRYSSELTHFGVKGMKWGVRRSSQDSPSTPKKNRNLGEVSTQLQSASKSMTSANDTIKSRSKLKTNDLSELTDAELKKRVERLNLEARYNTLAPPQVSRGREYLHATLETAGATLAIASSAIALAAAIKQLKG